MESYHNRKLLPDPITNFTISCCAPIISFPPPSPPQHKTMPHISPFVVIIVGILGGCFLLVSYYAIIVKYCTNMRNSRNPVQELHPADENLDHEEFLDADHGPVLDHPIWYIHTVGLPQNVIDSIVVFKFSKGEGKGKGIIEGGADCSVCLSEFEDGESLRLLPKCSHAFHMECIDTWLRSHTNCPSCRAPVVAFPVVNGVDSSGSSSVGENDVENVENVRNAENGASDLNVEVGDEAEEQDRVREIGVMKKNLLSPLEISESEFRVLSDLSETHRLGQDRRPPVRRSASMDFNPASVFCFSVANSFPEEEDEGDSSVEKGKKDNASPGIGRLIGSSSKGRLLGRTPAFMKRSVSTGGKPSSSKSARSQSSVLPL